MRLSRYVVETREELRKCTWPTWPELKGSTVVVMITILLLGLYIAGVDFAILKGIRLVLPAH
ncbi:MAG: preprotein translocase subunit SecE [Verrucomicrobiales bacterium]|nr:preprotein translocase subunit SecE [Verrucomicrobiales bacterium]